MALAGSSEARNCNMPLSDPPACRRPVLAPRDECVDEVPRVDPEIGRDGGEVLPGLHANVHLVVADAQHFDVGVLDVLVPAMQAE
jgi:hypothetical protein